MCDKPFHSKMTTVSVREQPFRACGKEIFKVHSHNYDTLFRLKYCKIFPNAIKLGSLIKQTPVTLLCDFHVAYLYSYFTLLHQYCKCRLDGMLQD